MGWDVEEYIWSAIRLSDGTKEIYSVDLEAFHAYCQENAVSDPSQIDLDLRRHQANA